jgi:hypothetical protein
LKPLATLLAGLAFSGPALASDADYYVSGGGDDYAIAVNDNGYVLQSRYPKARLVDKGAASYVVRGIETFYFGRNCDASHAVFGAGKWGWANGGFGADFDSGYKLRFARQELPGPHTSACGW